jgi:hypothetical protein
MYTYQTSAADLASRARAVEDVETKARITINLVGSLYICKSLSDVLSGTTRRSWLKQLKKEEKCEA